MSGQQRSVHKTLEACQRRCASVWGCSHFSYQADTGGCHLESEDAVPSHEMGFTSGPGRCATTALFTTTVTPLPALAPPATPAKHDILHNSMLLPGIIATGGIAAAGGIAGIGAAVAANSRAGHHPTFPPVPKRAHFKQQSGSLSFVPKQQKSRLVDAEENSSSASTDGLMIWAVAVSLLLALALAVAWFLCCCHRDQDEAGKRPSGRSYNRISQADQYEHAPLPESARGLVHPMMMPTMVQPMGMVPPEMMNHQGMAYYSPSGLSMVPRVITLSPREMQGSGNMHQFAYHDPYHPMLLMN